MPVQHPYDPPEGSPLWQAITPASVGSVVAMFFAILPEYLVQQMPLAMADMMGPPPGFFAAIPTQAWIVLFGFSLGYGLVKFIAWMRLKAIRALLSYQGWIYDGKSYKTKAWALCIKLLRGPRPHPTYYYQSMIPKLPVPDLDTTLNRWLKVAEVLVSKEEFQLTKEAVEVFRRGDGPKLQAYLYEKAEKCDNWLYEYWLTYAYLAQRTPIGVNANYYTTTVIPEEVTTNQIARAATITYWHTRLSELIDNQRLQPMLLQDIVPLCMDNYKYLFNITRLPGEHVDTVGHYPDKKHIVVIRKGMYFKMNMYHKDAEGNDVILNPEELKIQLEHVCREADSKTAEEMPAVAALTTTNRSVWAKNREKLRELSPEALEAVETSMYVLVMDEKSPKDNDQHANWIMKGDGTDRWFDKCFCNVVYANGTHYSANVEHSIIDGWVFSTIGEYVVTHEKYAKDGDVIRDPSRGPRDLPLPKRLNWNVKGLESEIKTALNEYKVLADNLELYSYNTKYGKGFMKKCRVSPDGYVQMAMQLAFYRIHKEVPKTYEPSTHRMFLLGRTETCHTPSQFSAQFVKYMDDKNVPKEAKQDLLRKSIDHQTKFRVDTTVGRGCDRHLMGLYCASREMGMDTPQIFMDKPWSKPFRLSTSQTATRTYDYGVNLDYPGFCGGFAPTAPDGYGIAYFILGDNLVNFHVSSWKNCESTSALQFTVALESAFTDLRTLMS